MPSRALWILSRPRLALYVVSLPLVGFAWAHWDRAMALRGLDQWLLIALSWWALHAGTLWLNAALDRDEGEVFYGRSIPPPAGVVAWGYAALGLSVGLAFLANPLAGLCALSCGLLSVLYSHPSSCWKGHPIGGPLVNGVGYGLLSTLAGWSAAGLSANPRTILMWGLSALGVLGCYFAAQAFQHDEDAARGYQTLVVTHGSRTTLIVARWCLMVSFAGGMGLALLGWLPRICLVVAPLWWWVDTWLRHWAQLPGGGEATDAQTMANRVMVILAVCLSVVTVEYCWDSLIEVPVAGLSTVAGYPTDRPRLSPNDMLLWEEITGRELLEER